MRPKIILKMSYKTGGSENRKKDVAHLKYIESRPGAKSRSYESLKELKKDSKAFEIEKNRSNEFKLFGNGTKKQLEENKGIVWRGVISLKEEDAAQNGFDNLEKWENLLKEKIPKISKEMDIPLKNVSWVAAYHHKSGNPHVHFMIWEKEIEYQNEIKYQKGTKSQKSLNNIKSSLARTIFKEDFKLLNMEKDLLQKGLLQQIKKEVNNETKQILGNIKTNIVPDIKPTKELMKDFLLLAKETEKANTKRFAYLTPKGKALCFKISDQILKYNGYREPYKAYRRNIKKSIQFYKENVSEKEIDNAEKSFRLKINNAISKNAAELSNELFDEKGIDLEKEIEKLNENKFDSPNLNIINKTSEAIFKELQKESQLQEIEMEKMKYRIRNKQNKQKNKNKQNKERGR